MSLSQFESKTKSLVSALKCPEMLGVLSGQPYGHRVAFDVPASTPLLQDLILIPEKFSHCV